MIDLNNPKFCIWGYRENYHTHRHIHEAFYRALKMTRQPVIWVDAEDKIDGIDFSNTVFISEGQRASGMPRRDDCLYVVHNIDASTGISYFDGLPLIKWGVRCMNVPLSPGYIDFGAETHYWPNGSMDFPWGTDLLPDEVRANKPLKPWRSDSKVINWVGSAWHGGADTVRQFENACREQKIAFNRYGHNHKLGVVTSEQAVQLVKDSYMAPAIVSQHQVEVGYIPCRILKNISYGQYGITNSAAVERLFDGNVAYHPDGYQLFYDGRSKLGRITLAELHSVMDFVAENHTYLNRIDSILKAGRLLLESR